MAEKVTNRYRLPSGNEVEHQPGSRNRVLINKFGITSKREMDRVEYDALIHAQEQYLSIITSKTRFTVAILRRMHRDWLGSVYEWAGEYRTVNLTKGKFTWPPAVRIPANMETFERGLLAEYTPCKRADIPEIAHRISIVHAELLLIHPFREGNGRLARWLAELMVFQAGYPRPIYQFAGRGSAGRFAQYVRSVQKAYVQDYDDLTDFFVEALEMGLAREVRG